MNTFLVFFAWPNGSIWSNIFASIIWLIPSYLYARFHVRKIHRRMDSIHKKLDK